MVDIASSVLREVAEHAAGDPGREVCGLLFGTAQTIGAARRCANVADHPGDSFEIDPAALLAAYRNARAGGPAVVGWYHSHPGGLCLPSARDAAAAAPDGKLWLIEAGGTIALFRAVANGVLHGRFEPVDYRALDPA